MKSNKRIPSGKNHFWSAATAGGLGRFALLAFPDDFLEGGGVGQQDCGTWPAIKPSGNFLHSTLRPAKYCCQYTGRLCVSEVVFH